MIGLVRQVIGLVRQGPLYCTDGHNDCLSNNSIDTPLPDVTANTGSALYTHARTHTHTHTHTIQGNRVVRQLSKCVYLAFFTADCHSSY